MPWAYFVQRGEGFLRKTTDGSVNQNRQVYRLAKKVAAGASGEISVHITRDGTIERLRIRIYIGAQLDLRLNPYIVRKGGMEESLVYFADDGKKYLDGDDDVLDFTMSIPIYRDEDIVVRYINNDGVNDYDFYADLEIDHMGGAYRLPMYGVVK